MRGFCISKQWCGMLHGLMLVVVYCFNGISKNMSVF